MTRSTIHILAICAVLTVSAWLPHRTNVIPERHSAAASDKTVPYGEQVCMLTRALLVHEFNISFDTGCFYAYSKDGDLYSVSILPKFNPEHPKRPRLEDHTDVALAHAMAVHILNYTDARLWPHAELHIVIDKMTGVTSFEQTSRCLTSSTITPAMRGCISQTIQIHDLIY